MVSFLSFPRCDSTSKTLASFPSSTGAYAGTCGQRHMRHGVPLQCMDQKCASSWAAKLFVLLWFFTTHNFDPTANTCLWACVGYVGVGANDTKLKDGLFYIAFQSFWGCLYTNSSWRPWFKGVRMQTHTAPSNLLTGLIRPITPHWSLRRWASSLMVRSPSDFRWLKIEVLKTCECLWTCAHQGRFAWTDLGDKGLVFVGFMSAH